MHCKILAKLSFFKSEKVKMCCDGVFQNDTDFEHTARETKKCLLKESCQASGVAYPLFKSKTNRKYVSDKSRQNQ